MDERLERHLCNLHNEVFEAAESRINTECSITIREGISALEGAGIPLPQFPHYTWGYIEWMKLFWNQKNVPSLYVRVYRANSCRTVFATRSLTIREGISIVEQATLMNAQFPHYTWGYIEGWIPLVSHPSVPSLYVRVYWSFSLLAESLILKM